MLRRLKERSPSVASPAKKLQVGKSAKSGRDLEASQSDEIATDTAVFEEDIKEVVSPYEVGGNPRLR